jgi:hypothetical protein
VLRPRWRASRQLLRRRLHRPVRDRLSHVASPAAISLGAMGSAPSTGASG